MHVKALGLEVPDTLGVYTRLSFKHFIMWTVKLESYGG